MTWQDSMRKLHDFLEKTREIEQSPDITFSDDDGLGEFRMKFIDPLDQTGESHDLGLGEEFVGLLDHLLSFSPTTDHCKDYLKRLVLMSFNQRLSSQEILRTLTEPDTEEIGPFVQKDFAAYEFDWFKAKLNADVTFHEIDLLVQELSFDLAWAKEFLSKYQSFQSEMSEAVGWLETTMAHLKEKTDISV